MLYCAGSMARLHTKQTCMPPVRSTCAATRIIAELRLVALCDLVIIDYYDVCEVLCHLGKQSVC